MSRLATLDLIRRISRLMDAAIAIPGTKFRLGLDPIIGLIPGAGDLISTIMSAYVIYMAASFQLPSNVMAQMMFNLLLESIVGSIPLVGDWFDAAFKANLRNLDLLEQHLRTAEPDLLHIDIMQLSSAEALATESINPMDQVDSE